MPRTIGLATIAALLGAIVLALGAVLYLSQRSPAPPAQIVEREVRDFQLTNTTGELVTPQSLSGKWSLLFFGFTRCPDVCPTTLFDMGDVLDHLGPNADQVQPVFISVDPEWDTRERLADYMTNFDPRIMGLTGTMEQVRQVAKNYSVFFRKVPLDNDGYTIDHSAAIYLLNPDSAYVRPYSWQEGAEALAEKLTVEMEQL